ncbi:hypothetical protein M4951_14805 [Blastopirellula sp. J2-11]|uniref:hypothetical protein n=1 Tax=Blastopirellula sp. J2-11 TaxID=2943192 RepID=UPI0021CABB62|nr:hypothetical protein [Blastopirellula sp. J2-11]UUO09317.1 hypothetical protein M4951_14805 [Blastopirellula sp. J2-11]
MEQLVGIGAIGNQANDVAIDGRLVADEQFRKPLMLLLIHIHRISIRTQAIASFYEAFVGNGDNLTFFLERRSLEFSNRLQRKG